MVVGFGGRVKDEVLLVETDEDARRRFVGELEILLQAEAGQQPSLRLGRFCPGRLGFGAGGNRLRALPNGGGKGFTQGNFLGLE